MNFYYFKIDNITNRVESAFMFPQKLLEDKIRLGNLVLTSYEYYEDYMRNKETTQFYVYPNADPTKTIYKKEVMLDKLGERLATMVNFRVSTTIKNGFYWQGSEYKTDIVDQQNYSRALLLDKNTVPVKDKTGFVRQLTKDDFRDFYVTMSQHIDKLLMAASAYKQQIKDAQTEQELEDLRTRLEIEFKL